MKQKENDFEGEEVRHDFGGMFIGVGGIGGGAVNRSSKLLRFRHLLRRRGFLGNEFSERIRESR